jgi:iron-sulfur cluster assembly protein
MIPLPVHLTPAAKREIGAIMTRKMVPAEYGLRLGAVGSGCSGIRFVIGFDLKRDNDVAFDAEGISVFIEKKEILYLAGMQVDFVDTEYERGFIFEHCLKQ